MSIQLFFLNGAFRTASGYKFRRSLSFSVCFWRSYSEQCQKKEAFKYARKPKNVSAVYRNFEGLYNSRLFFISTCCIQQSSNLSDQAKLRKIKNIKKFISKFISVFLNFFCIRSNSLTSEKSQERYPTRSPRVSGHFKKLINRYYDHISRMVNSS